MLLSVLFLLHDLLDAIFMEFFMLIDVLFLPSLLLVELLELLESDLFKAFLLALFLIFLFNVGEKIFFLFELILFL